MLCNSFFVSASNKKIKNLFVVVASLVLCSLNLFAGFDPLSPRKYARKIFHVIDTEKNGSVFIYLWVFHLLSRNVIFFVDITNE